MKIAMLAPIAWSTPPRHYGPWEQVTSTLTEELVKLGVDVTLFATQDSLTSANLQAVCPHGYAEDTSIEPKVWECLHIAHCFEKASDFDLIHNQFDFLPLSYSRLVSTPVVTTIHGFSSAAILPVYQNYNQTSHYVAISNADKSPLLNYDATIYHGINLEDFPYQNDPRGDYLLFFGRIHPDKGTKEAIRIAQKSNQKLLIAGLIQDQPYWENHIKPAIDSSKGIDYLGNVGSQQRQTLLGNAMALLHPILFDEPFGLSIIESMACGTPVIAFNRGSMPELIKHNETGFLVDSVAQAVQAVFDIPFINRHDCRIQVEQNFTKECMANNYLNLYKKIICQSQVE
jgi:glycosyltransferase involved in cell wall biosynthesis